jgi:hypothetical protein
VPHQGARNACGHQTAAAAPMGCRCNL